MNNNNTIYHTRDNKNYTIEIYISLFYTLFVLHGLMAESKEELKILLRKMKEESENWLKTKHSKNEDHNIQSHYFMAMKTLFYWPPKSLRMVTTNMKLKRCLLLGRKSNLDSILKNRDIILLTQVHLVKAMVFSVVMYGCKSWTIMKAEH